MLMRDNWANAGTTPRLLALPTVVHGILPQALMRTLSSKTVVPKPMPANTDDDARRQVVDRENHVGDGDGAAPPPDGQDKTGEKGSVHF